MKTQNEENYRMLVQKIANFGEKVEARNGPTRSTTGTILVQDMREGFPLITGRKMYPRGVLGELKAFLDGCTYLHEFEERGCNFWGEDVKSEDGYMGRIYGAQWVGWPVQYGAPPVNQLKEVIKMMRTDPLSRRMVVSAWNVGDLASMCLVPCHYSFQIVVRPDLGCFDLSVTMRSVDVMLGLPSDILLYGVLMKLIGNDTKLKPRKLIFQMMDTHIYENHMDAANEYLSRKFYEPPHVVTRDMGVWDFDPGLVAFVNYKHHEPLELARNA